MNLKIIIIIFIVILMFNKKIIMESFSSNEIIKLYDIDYKTHKLKNEIFPLKNYQFYDYKIKGPNKINYLKKYYGKNVLTHGKRQYGNNFKEFKITNFEPANINKKHIGCNKFTKRCEFWNKENFKIPPCCARNLNEIFKHIIKVFKKNNIEYFAYWGTLIGAIRHKGIIPWDTDIDIYISDNDLIKIKNNKKIIKQLELPGHQLIFNIDYLFQLNYSKINKQHVDIFSYKYN